MANTTRQSRKSPFANMLYRTVDTIMRQMMFCLPGRIMTFDADTQLAQVECGVQRIVNGEPRTLPVINGVPVHFAGDGEWYFFHQITPGETEGLIHFSQRAIDTWIDQGGPAAPHENRILSADDAFFVPGFRSRPGKIPNLPTSGAGISNYSGSVRVHAKGSGLEITGDVDISGDATIGGISFLEHTHGPGTFVDGDFDPVSGESDPPA